MRNGPTHEIGLRISTLLDTWAEIYETEPMINMNKFSVVSTIKFVNI